MGISVWVCPYWCMWVHVGSGARSLALGAICLCRVNKVVMNTIGFGIG